MATKQQEIEHLMDVLDAVTLLREAEAPEPHHRLARATMSATCSIIARSTPELPSMSTHDARSTRSANASKPVVYFR